MKGVGAKVLVHALEQEGVKCMFGIPGVHNVELYDAVEDSTIRSVLVTHELNASFMADGYARATGGIGVCNVVPGPGLTNALSGVGEALLDDSPVVVLVTGVREDHGKPFQLHQFDQVAVARPLLKGAITAHSIAEIGPAVHWAFHTARSGCPGPVLIEIPANLYFETGPYERGEPPAASDDAPSKEDVDRAIALLKQAQAAALYLGIGTFTAPAEVKALAERLGAPVCTTMSAKGALPEDHPLSLGYGWGPTSPPYVQKIMKERDLVLGISCKFAEVGTGSYGTPQPRKLVHVDIRAESMNRHYPADLAIRADAKLFLQALLARESELPARDAAELRERIVRERTAYFADAAQFGTDATRVNVARFFASLRKKLPREAIVTTDAGSHTFWTVSQFPALEPRTVFTPTDNSAMGFGLPAALGAACADPARPVVAIVGDGCMLMSGIELLTASREGIAPIIVIFNDGKLSMIADFQKLPFNRLAATELLPLKLEPFAQAVGVDYARIDKDGEIDGVLDRVLAAKRPVIVDVAVDYSVPTPYFRGVVKTNTARFSLGQKARMIARALYRRLPM